MTFTGHRAGAGGAVDSVNGHIGVVVLDASDVGAAATPHAASHAGGGSDPVTLTASQISDFNTSVLGLLDSKQEVQYATAAALPSSVYVNGASGVGATLTGAGFGALTVDGQAVTVAQRVLVKNQVTQAENGIYLVTAVGSVAAVFVLTRALDYDQAADISAGDIVPVKATGTAGTANDATVWLSAAPNPVVVGTSAITFAPIGSTSTVGPLSSQVVTKTTTYTAVNHDFVLASASGGSWVLTLPPATLGAYVGVKKTDSSANAITVTPASGTIDGAGVQVIQVQYDSLDFISDGTNWFMA